jgi:hypothetical protein
MRTPYPHHHEQGRNPTPADCCPRWCGLCAIPPSTGQSWIPDPGRRESQYSKQMLKEMIERKRRNDFVRRREFDQLRKLRQRECCKASALKTRATRPSFFQSSMASPDERAVTLKKIDEIEAQMSQQWWKSKQSGNEAGETMPLTMPPGADAARIGARHPGGRRCPSVCTHGACYLGSPLAAANAPRRRPPARWRPLFANDSMAVRPLWRCGRCAASGTRGTPFFQPHRARRGCPCGRPAGEIRARTRS